MTEKPNTISQRNRRARLYASGRTSEGNPSSLLRPGKEVRTAKTELELSWEKERAGMDIKEVGVGNWRDRNGEDDREADKTFKPIKGSMGA